MSLKDHFIKIKLISLRSRKIFTLLIIILVPYPPFFNFDNEILNVIFIDLNNNFFFNSHFYTFDSLLPKIQILPIN